MVRLDSIPSLCAVLVLFVALTLTSCSPSLNTLNRIPVHNVKVQAVDVNENPVPGAVVETSNGKQTSTDSSGFAKINFGTVGVHSITVMADNRAPSTFTVTMPADHGDTLTARLGEPVDYTGGMAFMTGSFSYGQFYPMMFNWMFSSYGYNMDLKSYSPGEWTEWRIATTNEDSKETTRMRKAFLKEMDNGQQWWQIQMMDEDLEEDQYIVEVLFSEDRSSIRRIREKFGDEEPSERPVSEGWYTSPQQLTEESIEGAVTEEGVSLETPAGQFTSDLVVFGVSPGVDLKLWRVMDVPGGVVKYRTQDSDEEELIYENTLLDHGSDAETMLNSY